VFKLYEKKAVGVTMWEDTFRSCGLGQRQCIGAAPVNGSIVMSPDDCLMNMDYV
jgi:hypothetical protein